MSLLLSAVKFVKIARNRERSSLLSLISGLKLVKKSNWSKSEIYEINVFNEQTVTTRKSRKEVNNSLLFTSDRRIYDGITPLMKISRLS